MDYTDILYEEKDGYRAYYPAESKVYLDDGGWVIETASSSNGTDQQVLYGADVQLFL